MAKKLEKILDFLCDYRWGVFNRHWWRNFWYEQISSRIWPRQRWLTKHIPRTWRDKDTIMEICVFECIKDYVDGENALKYFDESQSDPTYPEHQKKFDAEVKEMYQLVTVKLPALEKEMEAAYDAVPPWDFSKRRTCLPDDEYERIYGPITRLETEINDLKTRIMVWAVTNRGSMWT